MTDTVKKLRSLALKLYHLGDGQLVNDASDVMGVAAIEIEKLRDVLRRVVVYPSGDRAARVAFVSVGCQVSFPLHPQTTWALELLVEFDQARRAALEGKP